MKASATHQQLRQLAHSLAAIHAGQGDAFGVTSADQRDALERIGAAPQRAMASQKPAGSDGGLFDVAHRQIELF